MSDMWKGILAVGVVIAVAALILAVVELASDPEEVEFTATLEDMTYTGEAIAVNVTTVSTTWDDGTVWLLSNLKAFDKLKVGRTYRVVLWSTPYAHWLVREAEEVAE